MKAPLFVDFYHVRCGNCRVTQREQYAATCPACSATFDCIMSNHAGLALKYERERKAAGVTDIHARVDSAA